MKTDFWMDQLPLWGVFSLTVVCVFLAICIGMVLGLSISRRPEHEKEAPLGTVVGSLLGLVAFMLAFSFGITAQIFQARRQLLLDEVNAIGTAYLRAGLLAEPHGGEIRSLLREYVDLRVNLAKEDLSQNPEKFHETVSRCEALQDQMWAHAVSISQADRHSPIDALFIDSLNTMIDLQTSRITTASYRLPQIIWYTIYLITIISMFMVGYQTGLSGKSNLKVGIMLALTFSAVLFLMVDLDRATEGYFRLSQKPMIELQNKLQMPTQETGYELKNDKGNQLTNFN
jgi:hypothetical protein